MITDRNLQPGMVLVAKYKGLHYAAVVLTDGKSLELPARHDRVGFAKPQTFTSPSAAAMAITGNSVNGWRFWTVEGVGVAAARAEELRTGAQNREPVDGEIDMSPEMKVAAAAGAVDWASIPEENLERVAADNVTIHHGATLDATDLEDEQAIEAQFEAHAAAITEELAQQAAVEPVSAPVTKRAAKPRAYNPIKRLPNQKAVPEGSTRYWCDGCAASFIAEELALTIKDDGYACPNGHTVASMRQAQGGGAFDYVENEA